MTNKMGKSHKSEALIKNGSFTEKMEYIASFNHTIKFDRWRDKWGHWRLGLDWKSGEDYELVVEKPTLDECLNAAIIYVDEELFEGQKNYIPDESRLKRTA